MPTILSRGNRDTELRLITVMRANGITGWRRGSKLTGKTRFHFSKLESQGFRRRLSSTVSIHATWPKNRAAFWLAKLTGNKSAVTRRVKSRAACARVARVRIWEHELARKREADCWRSCGGPPG